MYVHYTYVYTILIGKNLLAYYTHLKYAKVSGNGGI